MDNWPFEILFKNARKPFPKIVSPSLDFIEIGLTEKGNAVSPYTIKRR